MSPITEALSRSAGAVFRRCALQVNTWAYAERWRQQHHGRTEAEFNADLAGSCARLGVQVVGLADHDGIGAYPALTDELTAASVTVFLGFELTCAEGFHMVCLYPPGTSTDELTHFRGGLGIDVRQPGAPSTQTCIAIAKRVIQEQGGIWYAPHMTQANGLLKAKLPAIWRDERWVLAGHIPGSPKDLPMDLRQIALNQDPAYQRTRSLAFIRAGDVAHPRDLEDPTSNCLIKMAEPSIEALRQAFLDPDSRIRLEAPERPHAQIEAIAIDHGYLDGLRLHLADNLNAIIGGRGTGKSTLIEALRYALDQQPLTEEARKTHREILKENLRDGGTVTLAVRSQTQLGRRFYVRRRYGEPAQVHNEDGSLSSLAPADLLPRLAIYGQNEILKIATDEASKTNLLARFLPLGEHAGPRRAELGAALARNRGELVKASEDLDQARAAVAQLPKLREQESRYQELHLDEKLAAVRALSREKGLVGRVDEELGEIAQRVGDLVESVSAWDLAYLSDKALDGLPHGARLTAMRERIATCAADLDPHLTAITAALATLTSGLAQEQEAWRSGVAQVETELARAAADLPGLSGKPGEAIGREYMDLIRRIESIAPLQARLVGFEAAVRSLQDERRQLLSEWRDWQAQRFDELARAAKRLNKKELQGKLRIEVRNWGNREALGDFLQALPGVGSKKIEWLDRVDTLSIAALSAAVTQGADAVTALYGADGLGRGLAEQLAGLPPVQLWALEELELPPRVEIHLNVAHQGERYRRLSDLSTGQKCTAILHLLLLDSDEPLIVDQPEDHLDNAFIADRIVMTLRAAKQHRQFLFATHNANIPVFGDAEWIGTLRADQDHAAIDPAESGAIDQSRVRDAVSEILEGGQAAFEMRRAKYGY